MGAVSKTSDQKQTALLELKVRISKGVAFSYHLNFSCNMKAQWQRAGYEDIGDLFQSYETVKCVYYI